jgi:hypothetical protein
MAADPPGGNLPDFFASAKLLPATTILSSPPQLAEESSVMWPTWVMFMM